MPNRARVNGPDAVETRLLLLFGLVATLQMGAVTTHIWSAAAHHHWWFLALGTILYPVGVLHGIGCWMGVWG